MTLKPSSSSFIHLKAAQISSGRVVTHSVLTLLSSKPNLHFSAPCIHTLRPSHLTHTLSAQMFVWPLIEPDRGTDPAEKERRKKKSPFIFFPLDLFFVWVHYMAMQKVVQEALGMT